MEVRTARRQHQLRPEATNMRVTTHESENGCYYWFQLAVTARVSLRSTPEATQCRCHGVGWRRHLYDHNQPLQSRRRGCSAWPLHAKAMLRNWMKSSFVPRKGSDRDSPIRDFPSTLLYRSALQKNSLLGALLHIIYLGVTPLSPAAGKSRNDAPSAGSSHCCG